MVYHKLCADDSSFVRFDLLRTLASSHRRRLSSPHCSVRSLGNAILVLMIANEWKRLDDVSTKFKTVRLQRAKPWEGLGNASLSKPNCMKQHAKPYEFHLLLHSGEISMFDADTASRSRSAFSSVHDFCAVANSWHVCTACMRASRRIDTGSESNQAVRLL